MDSRPSHSLAASGRAKAIKQARALNTATRRLSGALSISACDAVICDSVRIPVRRRYRGYELSGQQLSLLEREAERWSPHVHKHFPVSFQRIVRTLLLCHMHYEHLAKLPEVLLLDVIERVANLTFWDDPQVDLTDGMDVKHDALLPPHKQASYYAKQVS